MTTTAGPTEPDGEVWRAAMEAAGFQCTCTWCPGHNNGDQRCLTTDGLRPGPQGRLVVGPASPSRDIARRPQAGHGPLVAWCPDCWARKVRRIEAYTKQWQAEALQRNSLELF